MRPVNPRATASGLNSTRVRSTPVSLLMTILSNARQCALSAPAVAGPHSLAMAGAHSGPRVDVRAEADPGRQAWPGRDSAAPGGRNPDRRARRSPLFFLEARSL